MTNINQFLKEHPSLKHTADLNAICAPLKILEIGYFSHVHVTANKQITGLTSCPDFFELYFKKGYQNADLHNANPINKEEYIVWDFIKRKQQSEAMHYDFMSFNRGHTFSIVINNESSKDCFHFATKLGNEKMNGRYLELLGALKNFIRYFKEKIDSHKDLKKAYQMPFNLHESRQYQTLDLTLDTTQFLKLIETKRTYSLSDQSYLTAREYECLKWLAQGKTFEETAIILNISLRTVKAHIASIKQKTHCANQFQLGNFFSTLDIAETPAIMNPILIK